MVDLVTNLNVTRGDKVILSLDNINTIETVVVLENIEELRHEIGFELIVSDLYCMEEIFLSFPKLEEWCKIKRGSLLKYVRECISKGIDYHENPNKELDDFKNSNMKIGANGNKEHLNKETLAALLLSNITHGTVFSTAQKSYSPCWYCDCCERGELGYRRKSCNIFETGNYLLGKEKLQSILNNLTELEIIDMDYISKLAYKMDTDFRMTYYNEILSDKGYSFKEIETIHKDLRNREIEINFGHDLFEQVYNYLYNNSTEESKREDIDYSVPKIRSFGF